MGSKYIALRRYVAKSLRLVSGEKYYVRNVIHNKVTDVMLFCMYHKDPTKPVYSFFAIRGQLYGTLKGKREYETKFDLHNHEDFLDQLRNIIKIKTAEA